MNTQSPALNLFLLLLTACGLIFLFMPRVRDDHLWRATVTPWRP